MSSREVMTSVATADPAALMSASAAAASLRRSSRAAPRKPGTARDRMAG